jgi:hypothetical protein
LQSAFTAAILFFPAVLGATATPPPTSLPPLPPLLGDCGA